LTCVATAFAVAMDAVAVSISSGMTQGRRASWRHAFAMAATFGAFQAAMPALGAALGTAFKDAIEAWDHWVAFAILAAVGAHMIREAFAKDPERPRADPFGARSLLALGLATSLDAAAVGLTLPLIDLPIGVSVAIIGIVTFLACVPAVRLGSSLGTRFAHRAELVGGVVLIAIGVKILVEHLRG
jgi:putative Mn2+ efflux pump MntP